MLCFSSSESFMIINNNCTEVILNNESHPVTETDLFTLKKGRIFTQRFEIKYSKDTAYLYENKGSPKKLIDTMFSSSISEHIGNKNTKEETFSLRSVPRNSQDISLDFTVRRFFVSKYLPEIVLKKYNSTGKYSLVQENNNEIQLVTVYDLGASYTAFENFEKTIVLLLSKKQGVFSKYNGMVISEIL